MTKNKRQKAKYPALRPELNLKTRYELLDYDYLDKLTEKEKAWLNDFTEEYVNASLDSKNVENNLHNTEELKKDCYRRNNARNRDILTRAKASGTFVSIDEMRLNKKAVLIDKEQELLNKADDDIYYLENSSDSSNDDGSEPNDF